MLLKNKGIRHIFYQEKATTKKKGSHLAALPFKVDGKVVFFEQLLEQQEAGNGPQTTAASFYTFDSTKNFVASS